MKQTVTAKVKVMDSSKVLDETMKTFSKAVQECIDWGWEFKVESKRELHDLCYRKIKDRFDLQSQLVCNAITQAWEMINNSKTKPEVSDELSIRYNFPRCASIGGDWSELSLSTIEGRKKFIIDVPECFEKYLSWEVRESNLIKDYKGRFFFCFTFSKEVSIEVGGDSQVLGVDLGINKLAVTSDGDFFGTEVKEKRRKRDKFVAELQSKGTRGAIRRLKEFGSSWKRFQSWIDHNISRKIIDKLEEGDVIVMEDLSYIRETASYNEWVHKWSFRQLQKFIQYKATLKGIRVVYIDPRNTSKRCSRCGSLQTFRKGSWFKCEHCDFTLDADLNASRNIAHSYMETLGKRVVCKPAYDTRSVDATSAPQVVEVTRKPLLKTSVFKFGNESFQNPQSR